MTPDPYLDLCELYALGCLDDQERLEFEQHLAGCPECNAGMQHAIELNEMILSATPRVEPRPQLRSRILASFGQPVRNREKHLTWSLALALAATLIIGIVHWQQSREQTSNAAELQRLREIQQILQSPSSKNVTFGPQPATPHGRVVIEDKLGMILIADSLPPAPTGSTYESWLVPTNGAPIPMEAFRSQEGRGVSLLKSSLPVTQIQAVAVSLEPEGVPVKTPTKVIFAAPLS